MLDKNGKRIDTRPLLMAGPCVIESRDIIMNIAGTMKELSEKLGYSYVFKASFDKANRSSITSFRGPGLEKGCEILAEIKETFDVPVISDIHEPFQAKPAAEVIDVLQLPAFLCRQTDLVVALAETRRPINVKKAQFLAAHEMGHIINKFKEAGNDQILLCERGSSFGYNNLVVDPLNFGIMKRTGCPVVFDVTHSLQIPGGRSDSAGGRRQAVFELMLAGMSQGIGGLFLESHPNPSEAKCDGPCALPLDKLEAFLSQAKAIDDLVKGLDAVEIE